MFGGCLGVLGREFTPVIRHIFFEPEMYSKLYLSNKAKCIIMHITRYPPKIDSAIVLRRAGIDKSQCTCDNFAQRTHVISFFAYTPFHRVSGAVGRSLGVEVKLHLNKTHRNRPKPRPTRQGQL